MPNEMIDKIESLKKLSTDKLIDVVKNYRQYGYDENVRTKALELLESRGVTRYELELTGNFINRNYELANELYKLFTSNSRIAFIFYGVIIIANSIPYIVYISFANFGAMLIIIKSGAYVLYFIFLVKSFLNQSQFYKNIGLNYEKENALSYLFLGMPFYAFMFFYFKNQMKEKMAEIR